MLSNSIIISIALGLLDILFIYVSRKTGDQSQKKWHKFFCTDFGPRTDVGNMSRKEIYISGRRFMVWAFHCGFLISIMIAIIHNYYDSLDQGPVLFFSLTIVILPLIMLVLLFEGIYLFFRGVVRSKAYDLLLTERAARVFDDIDEVEICEGI